MEVALTAAPEDEELLKLKGDLEQLLALSNALYQSETPSAGPSDASRYYVGQTVEAVYKGDGLFYPAKIDAISADGKRITVWALSVEGMLNSSGWDLAEVRSLPKRQAESSPQNAEPTAHNDSTRSPARVFPCRSHTRTTAL